MSEPRGALVRQLIELTRQWNEHDLVPKAQQEKCREIGLALNASGGMALMQGAYYEARARNRSASVIQAYWDGIGDWRW